VGRILANVAVLLEPPIVSGRVCMCNCRSECECFLFF